MAGQHRVDPAVKRRSQCVLWLASRCRYGPDCRCRLAQEADDAAAKAADTVPQAGAGRGVPARQATG